MLAIKNIGIVSLSKGILGEKYIQHEVDIGIQRIKNMGINIHFMPNSLKGINYLENHPEKRAQDLIDAFNDPKIDMILCAIGGDDTYLTLPYLFENKDYINVQQCKNKIFLGFSDSTINHFALYKLGIGKLFYGQSFLSDVCELSSQMLPYSLMYFKELVLTGSIKKISPSPVWFKNRKSYAIDEVGKNLIPIKNEKFKLLKGKKKIEGQILGGCVDTIHDMLFPTSKKAKKIFQKYDIFPKASEWKNKILLLETSENKMSPFDYKKTLIKLRKLNVLDTVSGILIGQPFDRVYEKEYQKIIIDVTKDIPTTIVANINIGHSLPRCIIPFNCSAIVDSANQHIQFR